MSALGVLLRRLRPSRRRRRARSPPPRRSCAACAASIAGSSSCDPTGSPRGAALFSHVLDPLLEPRDGGPVVHSLHWEVRRMAETLVELGFAVDAVSWTNGTFVPAHAVRPGPRRAHQPRTMGAAPRPTHDQAPALRHRALRVPQRGTARATAATRIAARHPARPAPPAAREPRHRDRRLRHRPRQLVHHRDLGRSGAGDDQDRAHAGVVPVDLCLARRQGLRRPRAAASSGSAPTASCTKASTSRSKRSRISRASSSSSAVRSFASRRSSAPSTASSIARRTSTPWAGSIRRRLASPSSLGLRSASSFPRARRAAASPRCSGCTPGLLPVVTRESSVDLAPGLDPYLGLAEPAEIRERVQSIAARRPAELQAQARAAWEHVRERHTREQFALRWREVVEALIDGSSEGVFDSTLAGATGDRDLRRPARRLRRHHQHARALSREPPPGRGEGAGREPHALHPRLRPARAARRRRIHSRRARLRQQAAGIVPPRRRGVLAAAPVRSQLRRRLLSHGGAGGGTHLGRAHRAHRRPGLPRGSPARFDGLGAGRRRWRSASAAARFPMPARSITT